VLLVANHPNSLLDPTLVVAAAHRPVRFLAKAPLFSDAGVGWLVRAAGAIPVYRRSDDPTQMSRNEDAFRAVYSALADGAAVGIFPEGVSHSEPSMVPLRTGAARIALGAAALTGTPFPIIPVGLVFRQKDVFRSEVLVFRGSPVPWEDLAPGGVEDVGTVRQLTDRIAESLRSVTLNLESWEDRPLVECAVRIWEAERGTPPDPADRVARLEVTTHILAEVRRTEHEAGMKLARDVDAYRRRLRRLHLRPADLRADVRLSRGVGWAVRRLHLLFPVGAVIATLGAALTWIPYRLTGVIVSRLPLAEDVRSTWKLFAGLILHALWIALIAVLVGLRFGLLAALASAVLVPVIGITGLLIRETWRHAWSDARRFFRIRSRASLVTALRDRQRELNARLEAVFAAFNAR
jgi:1-acyl-sn-glycerol-3-phosphate acyltransferase